MPTIKQSFWTVEGTCMLFRFPFTKYFILFRMIYEIKQCNNSCWNRKYKIHTCMRLCDETGAYATRQARMRWDRRVCDETGAYATRLEKYTSGFVQKWTFFFYNSLIACILQRIYITIRYLCINNNRSMTFSVHLEHLK